MSLKNKKQYYITEGHIDEDGNEYEKDYHYTDKLVHGLEKVRSVLS